MDMRYKFKFRIGDKVSWDTPKTTDKSVYLIEARRIVYEEDSVRDNTLNNNELREEYLLKGNNKELSKFWTSVTYIKKI